MISIELVCPPVHTSQLSVGLLSVDVDWEISVTFVINNETISNILTSYYKLQGLLEGAIIDLAVV